MRRIAGDLSTDRSNGSAAAASSRQDRSVSIIAKFRGVGLDLLALLWPTACVSCGDADRECCLPCRVELRRSAPPLQPEIGAPCFVRGVYEGPLRAVLVAFKHGGRTGLGRELGAQLRVPLGAALTRCRGPAAPVIVAAPSRRSSTRRRGYRHVDLLVSSALRGQGVRVLRIAALRAARGRRSQVGLSADERARNARRVCVRASRRAVLRGREVVLVDDVITTGATALACRDALEAAGANVVAVVALCHARRRDTREASGRPAGPPRVVG
jgi:predicted amidophosphoribosyltransferase